MRRRREGGRNATFAAAEDVADLDDAMMKMAIPRPGLGRGPISESGRKMEA